MTVLLVTPSADVSARVGAAAGGSAVEINGAVPNDPSGVLALAGVEGAVEVVVLDGGSGRADRALHLASGFDRTHPEISVVLVADLDQTSMMTAMRAGVREIVSPDSPVAELRVVLERATQLSRDRLAALADVVGTSTPTGRLIGVVSPKGGVGKTTVATNLAVGLAQADRGSTVLVDLDVQFGDVASALDIDVEHCLSDAISGRAVEDSMILKTYLTEHPTGLYVLCGPRTPADADAVTSDHIRRLLEHLVGEFRYVVVDTAPGLVEHTLTMLDRATDLVLVSGLDVPGVRGLRKELDTLDALSMTAASRQIVINMAERRSGMSVEDVQTTIGCRVDLVLPRHKDVLASVNEGIPLLQGTRNGPVSKGLRQLVERYLPSSSMSKATGPRLFGGRHRSAEEKAS